ncbi:hypothetical protein MPER_04952 [Moniliophthora perniciosa FA553]|nr:hypothetical protein MPER_04952 [Moniliophthora perniciosa FA553]
MFTHKFDATSIETMPTMREEGGSYEPTNCCYIFSELTNQDIYPTDLAQAKKLELTTESDYFQREHAGTLLAMLKSLGLDTLVDKVMQRGVHDLTNCLTMSVGWHPLFDSLDLWLEGTSTENELIESHFDQYDIRLAMEEGWWNGRPNHSRRPFTIDNETRTLPLPDPQILAVHAICARVDQMSGAAKYMLLRDSELEDSTVLAEDGSSAALLNELLLSASSSFQAVSVGTQDDRGEPYE